jgi:GR25 family glycosyltransferase involved in LPS biosynthesis
MSIRKPQNYSEEKRVEELSDHLGMLSLIVNSYEATEFKGLPLSTIKTGKNTIVLAALFLEDGNVALLVEEDDITFNIYHRLTSELISSVKIYSPPKEFGQLKVCATMAATSMKNILITYRLVPLDKELICYCDQTGKILWRESHNYSDDIFILGDDTVAIRDSGTFKLVNVEGVKVIDFNDKNTLDIYSINFSTMYYNITPYGKRGFICYALKDVYLYDDNLKEKKINVDNWIEILEVVDEDTIIYGTDNGILVIHNIKDDTKIYVSNLMSYSLYIKKIKLLPHNRCLVTFHRCYNIDDITVKIVNLKNLENPIEKEYYFGVYINYIGITNSGDLMLSTDNINITTIIIYNILTKQDTKYKILESLYFVGLSSFDNIITKPGRGNKLNIWE